MELQTRIVENGVELGTINNGKINLTNVDVDTLGRLYTLLSKPKPGDDYQGGIYVGEFEGRHYIVSKNEVKLNHEDAKEWCASYSKDGYDDWFLPNKEEINFLYKSNIIENPSEWYWSSTVRDITHAWGQDFTGLIDEWYKTNFKKTNIFSVRAIRVVN